MNDRRAGIILPFFFNSLPQVTRGEGKIWKDMVGGMSESLSNNLSGKALRFACEMKKNKKGEPVKLSGCFGEVLLHVREMLGNHHRWKSGNRTRPFCRSGSVPYDVRCARTYRLALPYALCDVRVMC